MKPEFFIDYRSTDTEAVVFWDLPETATKDSTYNIYLDGSMTGTSKKTHFSFSELPPKTAHEVRIEMLVSSEDSNTEAISLGIIKMETKDAKKALDITKAPYNAVGDGKVLNTSAIQKALDDCGPDSFVYIPSGTFLTE